MVMHSGWFWMLIGWLVGSFFGLGPAMTMAKGLVAKPQSTSPAY